MSPASPGLIEVVHEDLTYLVSRWPKGDIRDDEIRRSSTVLRRLFTYRELMQVWVTVIGPKDYMVKSDFIEILDPQRLREVDFATASPADQGGGMKIFAAVVFNKIQNGNDPIRIAQQDVALKKYLNQTASIISGTQVNRNKRGQFGARNLGGAHYDEGRQKPREQSMSAMQRYSIGNRPALIHEMLSSGQALSASPSTAELLNRLNQRGKASHGVQPTSGGGG